MSFMEKSCVGGEKSFWSLHRIAPSGSMSEGITQAGTRTLRTRFPSPKRQRGGPRWPLWLPNNGNTLSSRPFPPGAVVLALRSLRGPPR
jgi:hypothetical protein